MLMLIGKFFFGIYSTVFVVFGIYSICSIYWEQGGGSGDETKPRPEVGVQRNMQTTENSKKVIVIGDGVCGKTSLVAKITEGKFINNYHMTLGGKSALSGVP